eukprot:TRINITY_DN2315_c0_g2_i3.p3 TRINITY_DN2315_c0_g2~~TRINITY_DN2315_c0_g2_i3.p3  ORF type:complete len:201 (-),score=76.39 TRINITY_DN2315_c0_g2_i3:810-1412(-)
MDINLNDYDDRTALHLAASEGHVDAVKLLLHFGSNPSPVDRFGGTPLDDAIRHQHKEVAAVLREAGAVTGESQQAKPFKSNNEYTGNSPARLGTTEQSSSGNSSDKTNDNKGENTTFGSGSSLSKGTPRKSTKRPSIPKVEPSPRIERVRKVSISPENEEKAETEEEKQDDGEDGVVEETTELPKAKKPGMFPEIKGEKK